MNKSYTKPCNFNSASRGRLPIALQSTSEKASIILGLAAKKFSPVTISSIVGMNVSEVVRMMEVA